MVYPTRGTLVALVLLGVAVAAAGGSARADQARVAVPRRLRKLAPTGAVTAPGPISLQLDYRTHKPAIHGRYGHVHRRLFGEGGEQAVRVQDEKSEGYYWTFVDIGTPPQRFSVIVDTGSGLTDIPCEGCTTCGNHMDPRFDPDDSSTATYVSCSSASCSQLPKKHCANDNKCAYTQSYAEGSMLAGDYITDRFQLGVHESSDGAMAFTFGCHTVETKLFVTQKADGIMGMNQQDRTVVSVLQRAGLLRSFMFSMCLTHEGGQMLIGGYNASQHLAPPRFLPLLSSSTGMYKVQLNAIAVDGVKLPVHSVAYTQRGGCIVDSGTTFTYVPDAAHGLLIGAINRGCKENCTRTSVPGEVACFKWHGNASSADLPTIQFRFATASVDMPPGLYLVNVKDNYCVGIYNNQKTGTVIGSNAMRGYDVIFDRGQQRVGFAPARCQDSDCPECAVGPDGDDGDSYLWILFVVLGLIGGLCVVGCFVRAMRRCRQTKHGWQQVQTSEDGETATADTVGIPDSHPPPPSYDEAVRASSVQALSIGGPMM